MISSKDRSYYIGASDTSFVVGNWETQTFAKWWGCKQGIYSQDFSSDAMKAGTNYEHKILESLNIKGLKLDYQKIIGRLRVNLDGNTKDCIYEVKTHSILKPFKPSRAHINQVNVEMYGVNIKNAYIVSYALTDAEYNNYYMDIDNNRIAYHKIEYDAMFINSIYLPRLYYLSECLERGDFPRTSQVN